jgi:competence protein ComEA
MQARERILTFIILAVMIGVGVLVLQFARPTPVQITLHPPLPTATPAPSATPAPILVYVSGAVVIPNQTILLAAGSRVADALAAVGGTTANADLAGVNFAALLHDGDQVHVPERGVLSAATPTAQGGLIVHINSDSAEVIAQLPGIGAELAARIVAYRTVYGLFTTLNDLDAVEGIGEGLLQAIAPFVHFD